MTIRDLERRLGKLEELERNLEVGATDTFLSELSNDQLVNLALDLNALDEQGESQPCWPEWLDKPSEEECAAIHERFKTLERQRGGKEASARTSTRDLLVVALLDSSSSAPPFVER